MHGKRLRLPAKDGDRQELLEKIDVQTQHVGRACDIVVGDENRISIGRTLHRSVDADRAAGAGAILNHDLLAELARHVFADDAGNKVEAPAGGKRHDETHWSVGPAAFFRRALGAGNASARHAP